MDWRQFQEDEKIRLLRLFVREEIHAVLEDIRKELNQMDQDLDPVQNVLEIIDAVQTKIKERGTDGHST